MSEANTMTDNQDQKHADVKVYSKEDIEAYVSELEKNISESNNLVMHSLLAINHILRLPNAPELLTEDLQSRLKELWLKVKMAGLQLDEPPLLFGIPEMAKAESNNDDNLDDGTAAIKFTLPPEEEPRQKTKKKEKKVEIEEEEEEVDEEDFVEEEDAE